MKKVTFAALAALTITACSSGPKFQVNGDVSGADGKMLYLEASGLEGIVPLDSVKLKGEGTFSFKQPRPESPEFYRLRIDAASITDCDKEKVANMLLYHIVDGEYSSYGQLQVEPMFVLTMLKGENGLMTMSVWKNPWQAAVGKILVNQTGSNGKSPQRQAKTSNILPTNGVIHIFENYCKYSK